MKGQMLKWFGYVERKEATRKARAMMDWRLKGRKPNKCWVDGIKKGLETENCRLERIDSGLW